MCQNGGTQDPDSCTCDCLPEFSGDMCESEFIRMRPSHWPQGRNLPCEICNNIHTKAKLSAAYAV